MVLLDLPNETLDNVAAYMETSALENTALCSRRLYRISEPHIMRHRYGNLRIGAGAFGAGLTPMKMLCDILLEPRIAPYVTSLEYFGSEYRLCKHAKQKTVNVKLLYRALTRCKYISNYDVQWWAPDLIAFNQDAAFALLLTLLLNLEEIHLPLSWTGSKTKKMIKTIVEWSHTHTGPHALSKLRLAKIWDFYASVPDLTVITIFGQLPSMKTLLGSFHGQEMPVGSYDDQGTPVGKLWALDWKSNVEDIDVTFSNIAPSSFSSFLSGFTNLRAFYYHVQCDVTWDPNVMRKALLRCAKGTLEVLHFICRDHAFLDVFMGSLREFKVLKSVETDYRQFIADGITHRLVDMLPRSLEAIILRDQNHDREDEDPDDREVTPQYDMPSAVATVLFSDISELRHERLPNLQRIYSFSPTNESFKVSCQNVGITLITVEWLTKVGQNIYCEPSYRLG